MVNIDDLSKIEFRVGKILAIEDIPEAKSPVYKLEVSFGHELGNRVIVAGIKNAYTKEELLNKKIICITNLEPKKIANVFSNGMLLAAGEGSSISLLTLDKDLPEGSTVR